VRRAQSTLKIHTDASARFSRGVDPTSTLLAIRRAVALLQETCPDIKVTATGDAGTTHFPVKKLTLHMDVLARTMGATYTLDEVVESLTAVGITATPSEDKTAVYAMVPPGRSDVMGVPDLQEEVARLVGYDRLPETLPVDPIPFHPTDRLIEVRERVRDLMVRAGLQEVITYTLTDPHVEARLVAATKTEAPRGVAVRNPVSAHHTAIRTTLFSGLLETLRVNVRHTHAAHIFEIGTVVTPVSGQASLETQRVAFALMGPMTQRTIHETTERSADFFDASQVIHSVLRSLHVEGVTLASAEGVLFQPGLTAKVFANESELGVVGVVHPTVLEAYDLAGKHVVVCELQLEALVPRVREMFRAAAPPRFPSIELDVSMFVAKTHPASAIEAVIHQSAGKFLRSVTIRDVFEGPQVPEGHRSIMVRVEFNANDRSLTMEEAQSFRATVTHALRERVAADVRE
jgi:phenylalanyl-tRNA synthetase beta chain